jgi:hypothetical protein
VSLERLKPTPLEGSWPVPALLTTSHVAENRPGPSNLGNVISQILLCKQITPDFRQEEQCSITKVSQDVRRMVQDMQEFMPQQENNTGGSLTLFFLTFFLPSSVFSFVSSLPHISTASHFPFPCSFPYINFLCTSLSLSLCEIWCPRDDNGGDYCPVGCEAAWSYSRLELCLYADFYQFEAPERYQQLSAV